MAGPAMKFNPGFLTDQELVDSFCVRVPEFEMLVEAIRESTGSSNPHQLVVGPRGSGKTTLLLRVAVEVRRDPELRAGWIPIIFPEESYEIATCGEFWMQCLTHLANQAPKVDGGIDLARALAEIRIEKDDQRLAVRCLGAVLDFARQADKRLLLIVENLNMLFDDINDPDVGWQLRHTLQNEKRIFLLASATSRFEEIDRYGRAMYDLFNVQELKRLDTDACAVLWKAVSNRDPERNVVRSLEILTGGNPRLLAIVARFGSTLSFGALMDSLLRLVDEHTEYFKSHLDSLGVQDRRVYLALARLWKPATAREVSELARLPTSNCSAVLGRLVARGAVLIGGGAPRRKQYYVAERMYNIYYLLRTGRGSDRLVEALVRFMRSFYSQTELLDYLGRLRGDLDPGDSRTLFQFWHAVEQAERIDLDIASAHDEFSELEELAANVDALSASNDWGQVVEVCEKIESLVSGKASLTELHYMAHSRNVRAGALDRLGRLTEALDLFTGTWASFSAIESPPLLREAAFAGRNRISLLVRSGHSNQTILEACEAFLERFGQDGSSDIAELQVTALYDKAIALHRLGRTEDALAVFDELVARFDGDHSPRAQICVVSALHTKGTMLGQSGRFGQALETYDSVIRRFGDSKSPVILREAAMTVVSKGVSLAMSNQLTDALLCFDEAIVRLADHRSGEVAEAVATARFGRALALERLGESQRAMEAYDHLTEMSESSDSPRLMDVVASAFRRKAVILSTLDRCEEARAIFDSLIVRLGEEQSPEGVRRISAVLLERARLEIRAGQFEAALGTINEALRNPEAVDDEDRLSAPLLRAEIYLLSGCRDACERELGAALELLPTLPGLVLRTAIEALFAFTARLGPKPMLDLIDGSPSADRLRPFAVALSQELDIAIPVAREVAEVARDIRTKLTDRRHPAVLPSMFGTSRPNEGSAVHK